MYAILQLGEEKKISRDSFFIFVTTLFFEAHIECEACSRQILKGDCSNTLLQILLGKFNTVVIGPEK